MHSNELQCQETSYLLTCADQWGFLSAYAFAQPDQNLHWEHNANSAAQMRRQHWIVGGRTCQKVRPFWRCGSFESHYENTPIQIYWNFYHQKMKIFRSKNCHMFHISAQNIDCGYSLELPRWGGSNEYPHSMFLSRNKQNNVYPCKPQFYYIKVGFKGVKII